MSDLWFLTSEPGCVRVAPNLPKQEADIWSCGIILYILLCGWPPFHGESTQLIFKAVMSQSLDMRSDPWPRISDAAKDCVRRMLTRDPKKRLTAEQLLRHPWMKVNGAASDAAMTPEFLMRLHQFGGMNHLKKEALKVCCAVCLCSCACPESLVRLWWCVCCTPVYRCNVDYTCSRSVVHRLHTPGCVSHSRLACATTALLTTLSASWPLLPPAVGLHPWLSQSHCGSCILAAVRPHPLSCAFPSTLLHHVARCRSALLQLQTPLTPSLPPLHHRSLPAPFRKKHLGVPLLTPSLPPLRRSLPVPCPTKTFRAFA